MRFTLSWQTGRRVLFALLVLPFAVSLPAAEAKRRFDLPAGDAAVTLARFAEQADREIVFSPAAVRGVLTNAVTGEFAPREALDRLVAATGLVITSDAKSGALAVRKGAADPNGKPEAQSNASASLPNQGNTPRQVGRSATGVITGRVQNVVTGQYLSNAEVKVRGTKLVAMTDQIGNFILPSVPAGSLVLDVNYTGLESQVLSIDLAPGQTIERNVDLKTSAGFGDPAEPLKLDAFVVATGRETDAESIAINEQRYAANLKNVIATDSLGAVTDGNVGEFLKFLPGLTAEYDVESGAGVASVAVRGFPTHMAVVSADGLELANTGNPTGSSRVFQFTQSSINNTSRVEVTKVPLPSTPADSVAGSIDMISKSSFERSKAQFRFTAGLTANHPYLELKKLPHTSDELIWKIRPSGNLDLTLPLSKTFGIVLTAASENRYMYHQNVAKTYATNVAGTNASVANPLLQTYTLTGNAPRTTERNSVSLRVDWRVTPRGVLAITGQASRFVADRFANAASFGVGGDANPTVAGGVRLTFGPDFVSGATGRGTVAWSSSQGASVVQKLDTRALSATYRYDDGNWRVESAIGVSLSYGGYEDLAAGRIRQFGTSSREPIRLVFSGINEHRPQVIEAFDNANRPFDIYNLNNFVLRTILSYPRTLSNERANGKINARKSLLALDVPMNVQVGASWRRDTRDNRLVQMTYNYNGPDGNPNTLDSAAPYAMRVYVGQPESFGFRNLPYISPRSLVNAWRENPNLLSQTPAQERAGELSRRRNSQRFQENVDAGYVQSEAKFLENRLRVVTGVRFEQTRVEGEGPLNDPDAIWSRNPDGSFARTSAGARIRRPEAGAAGSIEELNLTVREREARGERRYHGYYPSLHLTYTIRENILFRAAYAKTYGRPDLANVIPNTTIDENDLQMTTNLAPGVIDISNPALLPWTADSFDLSLELYTKRGGSFSAGVFRKDIAKFFAEQTKIATLEDLRGLDLGEQYVGWELTSTYNLPGTARVQGVELSARHTLEPLGRWGRSFQAFANATKLHLSGNEAANFRAFIPESYNWGLRFANSRWSAILRWNYRGTQRLGESTSIPGGFNYMRARLTTEANVDLRIARELYVFVNVQNLFNVRQERDGYGPDTPGYARLTAITNYGPQMYLGIKGTY